MPRKRKKRSPKRREGKFTYYECNGTPCCRRIPDFVRQTTATREAASRFGMASTTGRIIRHAFAPWLRHNKHDGEWVNRLNARLLESGADGIKGYRFIEKTSITQFLQFPLIGEDRLLHIQHFFMPWDKTKKITHMEIRFIAIRLDLRTGTIYDTKTEAHMHDVKKTFTGLSFDTNLPGKGSLLVALQVSPYQHTDYLEDQYFIATDLIVVEPAPPETYSKKHRKQQRRQELLREVLQLPSSVHPMVMTVAQEEKILSIPVVAGIHHNNIPQHHVQRE